MLTAVQDRSAVQVLAALLTVAPYTSRARHVLLDLYRERQRPCGLLGLGHQSQFRGLRCLESQCEKLDQRAQHHLLPMDKTIRRARRRSRSRRGRR